MLRTNRLPFIHARASWQLTITTVIVMAIAVWLPGSALGGALGLTPLPALYWPILGATALSYVVLTQLVKMWLLRRAWI